MRLVNEGFWCITQYTGALSSELLHKGTLTNRTILTSNAYNILYGQLYVIQPLQEVDFLQISKTLKIYMRTFLNLIYREMTNKGSSLIFMNCSFNSHPESKWELKMNHSRTQSGYSLWIGRNGYPLSLTTSLHWLFNWAKIRFGLQHPVVFLTWKWEGLVSFQSSQRAEFHFDWLPGSDASLRLSFTVI